MKEEFKNKIILGDCLEKLKELESDSVDSIVTDPPYALTSIVKRFGKENSAKAQFGKDGAFARASSGFMGKTWDAATPSVEVWAECLRVAKAGAFAFVCMTPRQDSLAETIYRMGQAGWNTGFTSLYWTYASGFPKAMNIGKMVDKRNGAEREILGENPNHREVGSKGMYREGATVPKFKTKGNSPLEGSYGGFQPKPAVEVIIVAMKPLSEKTYVDQALKNGKGITWLDECRIGIEGGGTVCNNRDEEGNCKGHPQANGSLGGGVMRHSDNSSGGRFPANLLVSDDVLNDGRITKSTGGANGGKLGNRVLGKFANDTLGANAGGLGDSGSYSRYFDLDTWASTLPFLIVPKASKSEKNRGLEEFEEKNIDYGQRKGQNNFLERPDGSERKPNLSKNFHPTVKPLKLMSYLITLGSRPGDTILDPFSGSCTTLVAAKELKRNYIGIEREGEYVAICEARLEAVPNTLF